MKIEDEIKQPRFRNEYHKAAVNISYTYYWLMDRLRQTVKPFGISMQQFNILRILRGQHPKPATINLLKERMMDKSSDASRLVERLRKKGLVERLICEKDRRSVDIVISDKGLKLLSSIDKQENEMDSNFKNLTEEEARTLNMLMDKLRG